MCVCVCVCTCASAFLITDVCVILRVYFKVSIVHRPMHAQGGCVSMQGQACTKEKCLGTRVCVHVCIPVSLLKRMPRTSCGYSASPPPLPSSDFSICPRARASSFSLLSHSCQLNSLQISGNRRDCCQYSALLATNSDLQHAREGRKMLIVPCHSQKPASSMTPQGHTAPARPAILLPGSSLPLCRPLSSVVYPGSGGSQIRG